MQKQFKIMFFVSSMHGGGAERVAAILCNDWVEKGHDVLLMPTYSGRGDCSYPLKDQVRVDYLADKITSKRKNPWTMFSRFLAMRRAIKEYDPDVIVSFLTHVNVAVLLATRGLPVPVIVAEHSYPPALPLGAIWAFLRKVTYRWAERVVALTIETAQWLEKHCPDVRVVIIPNPVILPLPKGIPDVAVQQCIGDNRKIILAVGRLSEEKGFAELVEIFASICKENTEWDLVIVGAGELAESLEQQVKFLNLGNRVFFPGRVGNVSDWYERADLYVLNSLYEGFPNVLVEAMAHGVPAVSVDCNTGPRDIIRVGIDGLLVPVEEGKGGMAVALKKLMLEEKLRNQMSARAKDVCQRFSLERIGSEWTKLFGLTK